MDNETYYEENTVILCEVCKNDDAVFSIYGKDMCGNCYEGSLKKVQEG